MAETSEAAATAWSHHRGLLLDVAYRLLGSYGDAEDVVQEAFSRLLRDDLDPIDDVLAWLVVVVSRLCLDHLRSARTRRETTVGPWLPEPLVGPADGPADPADRVTLDESVRTAFLVVLERMSPAERVVFVLHDVFAMPFDEVAAIVGRSPAACRQLASRARRWLQEQAGAARFRSDPTEQRQVVDAFIDACASGEVAALLPLLDPSVAGWADVGEDVPSAREPTVGAQAVAEGVLRFLRPASGTTLMARTVNGDAGVVALRRGRAFAVLALDVTDGRITELYAQVDPRKLTRLHQALTDSTPDGCPRCGD